MYGLDVKSQESQSRGFSFWLGFSGFFQHGTFAGWTLLLPLPSWYPTEGTPFRTGCDFETPIFETTHFCHLKPLDVYQFFLDHTYFRTMELRQRELVGVSNIQSYWEATTLLGILKRVNNTVPYHSPVRKKWFHKQNIWSSSYFYGMTFYRDFPRFALYVYNKKNTIYCSPFFSEDCFLG